MLKCAVALMMWPVCARLFSPVKSQTQKLREPIFLLLASRTGRMGLFDGLHAQCRNSIDADDSDTSEDSDMAGLIVDVGESKEQWAIV